MLDTALIIAAATALGAGDGKVVAQDSWQALTILEVGASPAGSPQHLRVAAGDLDGDGAPDEAYLKLVCADGAVHQALLHEVKSPRDTGTGQTSERRQHGSIKIVKEWGPTTPQLRTMKVGYDVKKAEGGRIAADGWRPVNLSGADGLCQAAAAAAATIVNSKSNITHNGPRRRG